MFDSSELIAAEWDEALRGRVCLQRRDSARPPAAISSLPGHGSADPGAGAEVRGWERTATQQRLLTDLRGSASDSFV